MSKKNRQDNGQGKQKEEESQSRLADYFWANLIFFGFLFLLSFLVWQSCQAPSDDAAVKIVLSETFRFMIYLFGGGFLVVTLFDAAFDFFAEKAGEEPASSPVDTGSQN